ncbi:MAG: urease accessory protein UreF, partial [Acidimicrobiales bacterium]
LGLDPLGVAAVIAGHEKVLDAVVARAVAGAGGAPCELPAPATPWFDLFAQYHADRKDRLFAS